MNVLETRPPSDFFLSANKRKMQSLFQALLEQARSLLHLGSAKYINTGDRTIDMAIHVLTGTILALITNGIIAFFTKGYKSLVWRWLKNKASRLCRRHNDSVPIETQFDLMANASTKPISAFNFVYYSNDMRPNFDQWFLKFHYDKNFQATSYVVWLSEKEDGGNRSFFYHDDNKAAKPIPIWQELNGDLVYGYYQTSCEFKVAFYSDSMIALRNCVNHIIKFAEINNPSQSNTLKKAMQLNMYEPGYSSLGNIDIRATFDSLFFKEKTQFMDLLCRFKERRMFPAHLPIENKLGILLHGPPGTGKTRLIAATANFLGYNVLMLDMTKIRTRSALTHILNMTRGKNSILVLEEFDCIQGILRRDEPAAAPAAGATEMLLALALNAAATGNAASQETTQRLTGSGDSDQLDLGFLLTKLDGLESNEGRIIIATTNHPERIDPALMRPGRLGLKICLSYATREVARDILCMVFELKEESSHQSVLERLDAMKENIWTPAVILQEAILRNSLDGMVEFLTAV